MPALWAEPYHFVFQPEHVALLIIDMQRDFVDPGGFGEALGNDVSLNVRSEISNFARPSQEGSVPRETEPPILRQLKIDASTVAVLGKPIVIGSVDDPNSKRQFQLEVTVTKLR